MRRRRKNRAFWLLMLLLVAGALLLCYIRVELEPLTAALASARVRNAVSRIINSAISDKITDGEIDYDRMIYFEKNSDGDITALKTNMSEVNRLKTEVLSEINDDVGDIGVKELGIPLGSVLLPTLFNGDGPKIPLKITSVSASDAKFDNAFTSAGINQTRHQIIMDVTVDVVVFTPYGHQSVECSSQVVVAETVLVGGVPGSYFNFNETDGQDS